MPLLACVLGAAVLAGIDAPAGPVAGFAAWLAAAARPAAAAGLLLAACVGTGTPTRPMLRRLGLRRGEALVVAGFIGLALLLAAGQIAGALGLLSPLAAAIGIAPGLAFAAWHLARAARRAGRRNARDPGRADGAPMARVAGLTAFALGAALLLVAATLPPGTLWASEYGGFDALGYHLQMPREWLARGRIAPLTHNVYSALPGSFESAFTWLAALTAPPKLAGAPGRDLLADGGWRLLAGQWLHALITLAAALALGCVAGRAAALAGATRRVRSVVPCLVAAAMLATPWVIVVGSLAYNEMPAVGFAAAALLVAMPGAGRGRSHAPALRGALVGLLLGAVGAAKPTALIVAGPAVLLVALACNPRRAWLPAAAAAMLAGVLMLAPWLARNAATLGNPLFPFATALFGTAHWTDAQAAAWSAAHAPTGGVARGLSLLLFADETAGPAAPAVARWRGLFNPQWAALAPAVVAALVASLAAPRARRAALVIAGALLLGLAAWVALTHHQSRFLLPLTVPAAAALGLSASIASRSHRSTRSPRAAGPAAAWPALALLALTGVQLAASVQHFLRESPGQRGALIALGPTLRLGELDPSALAEESPAAFLNTLPADRGTLHLIGDAAPLYLKGPLLWNTVWDRWPAAALADPASSPRDAAFAFTRSLRDAGVTHVLVNFAELARYQRSGYMPKGLTPEVVRDWIDASIAAGDAAVLAAWQRTGQVLVELR